MIDFALPGWPLVVSRYSEPRVLRTRATGTAFRVQSNDTELVITTGAGNRRPVSPGELKRTWPFIQRQASKTEMKQVTDNSSYIEAIYDDLRDALGAQLSSLDDALRVGLERERLNDQAEEIARLRDRLAELAASAEETEWLRSEHLAMADRDRDLRSRLEASDAKVADLERALDAARNELAARRASVPSTVSSRSSEATLKALSASYDRALGEANTLRTRVADLERDLAKLAPAAARVAALERELETVSHQGQAVTDVSVTFNLGTKGFGASHRVEPEAADRLRRAAVVVLSDPDSAVGTCRQVLEQCIREVRRIRIDSDSGLGFSEVLQSLYGDPVFPTSDWHLAKQLWSRASAIVHEGRSSSEVALWIWLGTMQIAELVPSARTAGDRRPQRMP